MKPAHHIRSIVLGMALLGIAMGSAALSLGRAQGLALVGQPLDLRIQVQFDNGEDLQAACLTAEVFYGDSQVDPSRVSVALDATTADPASRSAPVRVRAAAAVNEPVVTVQLRSGCQIRSSKRYTLLIRWSGQFAEASAAGRCACRSAFGYAAQSKDRPTSGTDSGRAATSPSAHAQVNQDPRTGTPQARRVGPVDGARSGVAGHG